MGNECREFLAKRDKSNVQKSMSFLGIPRFFVPGKTFNPDYPMTRKLLSLLLFLLGLDSASAQMSDNGDGTFTNPVIWADMPDPDVIQVGDTFYMVSTSMHMLPGVTLLQSTDLVNWSFAANVLPHPSL